MRSMVDFICYFCGDGEGARYGYLGQKKAVGCNGKNQKQGHEARTNSAPIPVFTRIPILEKCKGIAWDSRHSAAPLRHSHFHTWLFLARTQRR